MSPRARSAAVASAAAVVLALAGCGSSSSSKDASTTATAPAGAAAAAMQQRIAEAEAAVKAKPRSAQALADLAEAQYLAASTDTDPTDNSYGAAGRAHLKAAARAWERHLALNPKPPNVTVASMMALAYGKSGLDEPRKAIAAQLVVTQRRKDSASYQQLAVMAYQSGDRRTGDLAATKAVKLAAPSDRKRVRDGLRALRAGKFPGAR
jgi:hypothetical protein